MEKQNGVSLIFGQPQSGKSTRAAHVTRECRRLLVYDTAGHDYTDGIVVYGLAELRSVWRRYYQGAFRIIYRPLGSTREEQRRTRQIDPEFAAVMDMIRVLGQDRAADLTAVVDEVDRYEDRGEYDDEFADLLRRGEGHYGVGIIVVTQIPQGIGRLLTAVTRTWDIFQTAERSHIRYFAGRCGGVDPEDIRRLEKHEYIHYEQGADSYWLCRDNLQTGQTERREREYLYDRAWNGRAVADSRDVAAGETLANHAEDDSADLPPARHSGDSTDGRNQGSASDGTDHVPDT
jgi:hypothetical protein